MEPDKQLKHELALACGLLPNKDDNFIIISWDELLRLVRQIRRQRDQAVDELKDLCQM